MKLPNLLPLITSTLISATLAMSSKAAVLVDTNPVLETFDALSQSGAFSFTDASFGLPGGWVGLETASPTAPLTARDQIYQSGVANTTRSVWALGSSSSGVPTGERALGAYTGITGTTPDVFYIGTSFTNQTGSGLAGIDVSLRSEQWRQVAGGGKTVAFSYSLDATSLTTGTWIPFTDLDLIASISGSDALVDGNSTGLTLRSGTITFSTPITDGGSFWVRYVFTDVLSGADPSVGVDNFQVTAIPVPEPGTLGLLGLGLGGVCLLRQRRQSV